MALGAANDRGKPRGFTELSAAPFLARGWYGMCGAVFAMKTPRRFVGVLSFVVSAIAGAAAPLTFNATLSGANENPATGSPGTGFVTVVFDSVAHTLQVNANFSGLTGTTTASHIHVPTSFGVNGPVATQVPSFVGFPLGVTSGTFVSPILDTSLASTYNPAFVTSSGSVAAAEVALGAALSSGIAYYNIHTSTFGGGEIRGNLAAVGVPDSGTTALLLAPGLLLLVGVSRRLRAR